LLLLLKKSKRRRNSSEGRGKAGSDLEGNCWSRVLLLLLTGKE
jgi:hypothetical protein